MSTWKHNKLIIIGIWQYLDCKPKLKHNTCMLNHIVRCLQQGDITYASLDFPHIMQRRFKGLCGGKAPTSVIFIELRRNEKSHLKENLHIFFLWSYIANSYGSSVNLTDVQCYDKYLANRLPSACAPRPGTTYAADFNLANTLLEKKHDTEKSSTQLKRIIEV